MNLESVKKVHYTYCSYEEIDGSKGRLYIGCRTCPENIDDPLEDNYFGSYHDKTFKPVGKIILETFDKREDALQHEIYLHNIFQVDINPSFANQSKQTSKKFYRICKGKTCPNYGKPLPKKFKQNLSLLRRDKNIYHWYNKKDNLHEYCTMYELYTRYNLSPGCVRKIKNGKQKNHKGWIIVQDSKYKIISNYSDKTIKKLSFNSSGKNNPRYNSTSYHWYNTIDDIHEHCTMYDLRRKYKGLNQGAISAVKNNKRKIHKGWIIIN